VLPGVVEKRRTSFLAQRGKSAIGVDTHVGIISRALDGRQHIDPAKIEKDLGQLFPKDFAYGEYRVCSVRPKRT